MKEQSNNIAVVDQYANALRRFQNDIRNVVASAWSKHRIDLELMYSYLLTQDFVDTLTHDEDAADTLTSTLRATYERVIQERREAAEADQTFVSTLNTIADEEDEEERQRARDLLMYASAIEASFRRHLYRATLYTVTSKTSHATTSTVFVLRHDLVQNRVDSQHVAFAFQNGADDRSRHAVYALREVMLRDAHQRYATSATIYDSDITIEQANKKAREAHDVFMRAQRQAS